MGSFKREVKLSPLLVEFSAPGYKLYDPFRTLFNEYFHSLFPAKTISSPQGIFIVDTYLILITQGNSDSALGIFGAALPWSVFCNDKNIAMRCKLYGSPEAGNTTSHDEKIHCFSLHTGRITDRIREIKEKPLIPPHSPPYQGGDQGEVAKTI